MNTGSRLTRDDYVDFLIAWLRGRSNRTPNEDVIMNTGSGLTRDDYADLLKFQIFGSDIKEVDGSNNALSACIRRAYRDFCRTLHGISRLAPDVGTGLHSAAAGKLVRCIREAPNCSNYTEFDQWHQTACHDLKVVYRQHGWEEFYIGQAQKWINMTFKYIYTLGEQYISGYGEVYSFCHVPLDSSVITALGKYGFFGLSSAGWSRLNDYNKYLDCQKWIRERFKDYAPLDIEHFLWLGKNIV